MNHYKSAQQKNVINDIIDTSSFMLHAIFSQYFLPAK